MLRAIPSNVLACCVDGTRIPASAMQSARNAARLDHYAHRRAAILVANAQEEAEALRRRAAEDAYREARLHGARTLLAAIGDIGRLRSSLLEGVMAQARRQLRDHCHAAGFTAAWVERACQIDPDPTAATSRVLLPRGNEDDVLALRAVLDASVTIEQADVPCLRVEQGDLVLEYDPEHMVFDAAHQSPSPDMQVLHDGLAAAASRYADAVLGGACPHNSEKS